LHVEMSLLRDKKPQGLMASEPLKQYIALPIRHFFDEADRFDSFALAVRDDETGRRVSAIFLDSGTPEQIGGTGRAFDWRKAVPVGEVIKLSGFNLTVAGGLTSDNVSVAMQILEPWGVDVSSGVESMPGKKDSEKVRAFVAAVRQAEKLA
jgi:phosphoribosylanthranilate isomerase